MLLEKLILKLWYPDCTNKPNKNYLRFIIVFLLPFVLIYKLIINFKKYLYKKNILASYRPNVPVIVVGNITVGGTGKTPVIIELAKLLTANGYKPGIVLRGYKSNINNNNSPVLITEQTSVTINVASTGDEARLIFNNTNCPVAISKNRVNAVKLLLINKLCDIILSDDGMQHYKLARDIEVCVVDSQRLFGNNFLLPVGPLREEISRLKSVDYVLVKNYNSDIINQDNSFNFIISPVSLINLKTEQEFDFTTFKKNYSNKTIHALSAIGNNKSFIDLLYKLNFDPNNLLITSYQDHYCYKPNDFTMLNNANSLVITTEKDAVKIRELKINNSNNVFYLKISASLPKEFCNGLLNQINNINKI